MAFQISSRKVTKFVVSPSVTSTLICARLAFTPMSPSWNPETPPVALASDGGATGVEEEAPQCTFSFENPWGPPPEGRGGWVPPPSG